MVSKEKTKKGDEIQIPVKWIGIVLVLIGVVALIFIFGKTSIGSGSISEAQAEQKLLTFFETEIPTSQIQVIESSKEGNFYRFIVSIDGEQVPLFVTTDGNYMTIDLIPLE